MTKVKNILSFLVIIVVIVAFVLNYEKIINKISKYVKDFRYQNREIIVKEGNEYSKNKNYRFVEITDNFRPTSYNDLVNIFYTIFDKGWDEFTFYCDENYSACLNDVEELSNNQVLLSSINNYVHPYNSYSQLKVVYDDTGEIDVYVTHTYTPEDITRINNRVSQINNQLIRDNMSEKEKIKAIHDFVINNTKYDLERKEKGTSSYDSSKATGVLFQGYGICSGYADTMSIFLNQMGIDNFKVSSENHVWNAVWINDNWLHLDLTWDDPVSSDGRDVLQYNFFLINSSSLIKEDVNTTEHNFNNNYYFLS